MASRPDLREILKGILNNENLYYQPPASIIMKYPAIKYSRSDIQNTFANNKVYKQSNIYEVIVIDEEPESTIVIEVSKLPGIKFERHFNSGNLNHDVFTLHY